MADTKIKIKFKRHMGIALPNGSIISPNLQPRLRYVAGFGNVPEQSFDPQEEHTVTLPSETPEPPPEEIFSGMDSSVRDQYLAMQAQSKAQQHDANNAVRRALEYYQEAGHIELVSDSFMANKKSPSVERDKDDAGKAAQTEPKVGSSPEDL